MMKPPPLGQRIHELEARELLEQTVEVQHANLVGDALGQFGSVFRVLLPEQVHRLVRPKAGLEDGAGQHQAHLAQEIVPGWQPLRLADGPEPEGAPVVHHQF